jgi:hypothetical protein
MKLKTKIVALFALIFIASYVPENYPTAFGDWKCKGCKMVDVEYVGCDYNPSSPTRRHNPTWHWGFRHYLWFGLGLTLTAISVYQIVESENKL